MKRTLAPELLAALLILLFTYTALQKVFSIGQFQSTLLHIPGLQSISTPVAIGIPVLELCISTALIFPKTRGIGFWASFILLIVFTAYITFLVLFVRDLPCSCGGALKYLTWKQHIFFNLAFIAVTVAGIRLHQKNKNLIAINRLEVQQAP